MKAYIGIDHISITNIKYQCLGLGILVFNYQSLMLMEFMPFMVRFLQTWILKDLLGMEGNYQRSQILLEFDAFSRLTGSNVDLILTMDLGVRDAGKLEIKSFFMDLKLEDINAELECLFPRRGKCCPKKYLKSCNTILAKTVLRYRYTQPLIYKFL